LRIIQLAFVLPALILAACQNQSNPLVAALTPPPLPRLGNQGIDLPTDASDVLNELKGSPIGFVARYYRDPTSRWPTLTPSEAQRLSSLGMKIVTVWEGHSHNPDNFSYASGYGDAMSAYQQAKGVGQPAGSAIYFAVDFDARSDQLPAVDQYFRGIAAGFAAASNGRPDYKVGVYGSGAVCYAVKASRLAQYAWLSNSTAWGGSTSYDGWNIRQGGRFGELSFNHDSDEARDEYGGFQLGGNGVAAPQDALVSGVSGTVVAPHPPAQAVPAAVVSSL
jgi:hypothetical protein